MGDQRQVLEAYSFRRLIRSKTKYMECNFSKRQSSSTLEVKVGAHIIPKLPSLNILGACTK